MKLECDIIQELYPLYRNEASAKLKQLVDEHLVFCEKCREIFAEEKGFLDLVHEDNEIIQPEFSLDEKIKRSLKKQRYYQYAKYSFIFLFSIVAIYFLFFRFSFFIGSTNLATPSFSHDYERVQEKFTISEQAMVTNLSVRFNSAGLMEDFRTRIVDFFETHIEIYDMTFSPRVDGFHMYRVKHHHVKDSNFISKSQAQLPAKIVFSILDRVDYASILANVNANRFWLSTDGKLKDIQVRNDTLPLSEYFYFEQERIEELEVGQKFEHVFNLYLHTDTTNDGPVRSYLFQ